MEFEDYRPTSLFRNNHLNTIFPTFFRHIPVLDWTRTRFQTSDNDFFDVDLAKQQSTKILILLHGLEGNSQASYIQGMAKQFHNQGWDIAALNFRGCSGEPNKTTTTYHSGFTRDLNQSVEWAESHYKTIAIIGFSLGGNITLKYLGEKKNTISQKIIAATAISVPVDLHSSGLCLEKPNTYIYRKRFLKTLKKKVKTKRHLYPNEIDIEGTLSSKTIREFDDRFTAPIHGFNDADDYYTQSSSKQYISVIAIPTLIINARDDSFLGLDCYPYEECSANPNCTLLTPQYGGHVGFSHFSKGPYWSERVTLKFVESMIT